MANYVDGAQGEEMLLQQARRGDTVAFVAFAVRLALDRRRSGARTIGRSTHVHDALEQLQDLDRVALLLWDVEELPAHEVAAILEATPEETRTRTHRARLRLTSLFNHIA